MAEIGRMRMPFGRYGPDEFPPSGVPLFDLPYEYLAWFAKRGFPASRLGELMEMVYHAKANGAEAAFAPFRDPNAPKHDLRRPKRKNYRFD